MCKKDENHSVGELKPHFSKVPDHVKAGEEFAPPYGKKNKVVGYVLLEKRQKAKRKLGVLEGKIQVVFKPDFEMTTEEFPGA